MWNAPGSEFGGYTPHLAARDHAHDGRPPEGDACVRFEIEGAELAVRLAGDRKKPPLL